MNRIKLSWLSILSRRIICFSEECNSMVFLSPGGGGGLESSRDCTSSPNKMFSTFNMEVIWGHNRGKAGCSVRWIKPCIILQDANQRSQFVWNKESSKEMKVQLPPEHQWSWALKSLKPQFFKAELRNWASPASSREANIFMQPYWSTYVCSSPSPINRVSIRRETGDRVQPHHVHLKKPTFE